MTKRVVIEPLAATQTSRRDTQSEAFRVSFDYEDPTIAQKVVEKLASFFIDTNARSEARRPTDQPVSWKPTRRRQGAPRGPGEEARGVPRAQRGRLPTQMQANMQAIRTRRWRCRRWLTRSRGIGTAKLGARAPLYRRRRRRGGRRRGDGAASGGAGQRPASTLPGQTPRPSSGWRRRETPWRR